MTKRKVRSQNWQFDSQPLKVRNRPDFLAWRWRATYRWKDFNKGYNIDLDLISIEGLHTKLWASKIARVPTLGISRLLLGSLGTKWHLNAGLVARHKIRGKVVASPKSGLWWVLWVHVCSWLVRAPKCSNYALINLLFGWCRSMWVLNCLSIFLVPSWNSSMPFYPQSVAN
jgi:hypothetical protein